MKRCSKVKQIWYFLGKGKKPQTVAAAVAEANAAAEAAEQEGKMTFCCLFC